MSKPQWKLNLRHASFRDIPFYFDSSEFKAGRKTVVHDFPKRDLVTIEDMGRATREFSITAYFLGSDYQDYRDAFINAIEQKGAGKLVHPFYGEIDVYVTGTISVSENKTDGGYATVSISVIESKEPQYVDPNFATDITLFDAIDAAISSIQDQFDKVFSMANAAQSAIDKTTKAVTDAVLLISNVKVAAREIKQFQSAAQNLLVNINKLLTSPVDLSKAFIDILGADKSNTCIADNIKFATYDTDNQSTVEQSNQINSLVADSAIVLACVGAANYTFPDAGTANKIKQELGAAIDARMEVAGSAIYDYLHALRGALVLDINTRSENLPQIIKRTLAASTNVLSLAYDLYEDLDMADDIVSRNKIEHPGIIPTGIELELLSRG